jgi:homopolymeric O-antigen transport system ATP-binding protein
MTDFAIRAEKLSKRFWLHTERRTGLKERFIRGKAPKAKEFWALREASFEIQRGTTFGLMGQNGSGKSTTLKVLAGIYRPTSGLVEVNGRVSALLELGAGFHAELTGRENIRLNGAILGLSRRQIDSSMDRIIDFAGLGDFIDSPVKVYSSGMYVRLGFAVAVSLDPEILMVDEIIAVGDEEFQRKCFDHLHELRKRGSTIVLVSHSLGLIRDLCDQAAWLDHGHIRELGPAGIVADRYLADVNDREFRAGAALAQASGGEPDHGAVEPMPMQSETPHRIGSGEIRVTDVEYLDAEGNRSPILLSGSPCTFRIRYSSNQTIQKAIFGIGFFNEAGVDVSGTNSRRLGEWRVEAGSGYVDFELPELLLQPSTYRISAAIQDRGHTYDLADREYELRVRGSGDDDPGVARMPGVWKPPVTMRAGGPDEGS